MSPSPSIGTTRSRGPSTSTGDPPSIVREVRDPRLAANEFLISIRLLPRQAPANVDPAAPRDPRKEFWLAVNSYRGDTSLTSQLPPRAAGPTSEDMDYLENET